MPHTPGIGVIFGIVAEDGTPKSNSPVRLYDRTTGQLIRAGTTAADGGYAFSGLSVDTDDYQVLATDEDGTPPKNALVYDRIRPVNGASGDVYYANWVRTVGKYHPMAFVCGKRYASDYWSNVFPAGPRFATTINTGQVIFDDYAGLAGDPSLPALKLNNGIVNLYGVGPRAAHLSMSGARTGTTYTHFLIADMSTAWSIKSYVSTPDWSWSTSTPYLRATWSGTVLTVQLRSTSNTNGDDNNNWQTIATYTPSPSLTGFHSIAIAVFLGESSQVYIDGQQIATAVTNAVNKVPFASGDSYTPTPWFTRFYGENYAAGSNQRLVVSALLAGRLAQSNVQEIHNAFFVAQPPNLTGFKKEVVLDGASLFYVPEESSTSASLTTLLLPPMDRTGITDRSATTTYNDGMPLTPRGTLTVNRPSPIFGTNSTNFTSGCYRGIGGCSTGRKGTIFEFIIRRTVTSAPTALEYMARQMASDYATETWSVRLTTARKLQFFLDAAAQDTLTPNYTLPDNTWTHVVFQADRANAAWHLYVNGAWVESGVTNSTADYDGFNVVNGDGEISWNNHVLEFGGLYNNSNVMSNNFKGDIAAFAVYQGYPLLTPGRIQDHYNALTIL